MRCLLSRGTQAQTLAPSTLATDTLSAAHGAADAAAADIAARISALAAASRLLLQSVPDQHMCFVLLIPDVLPVATLGLRLHQLLRGYLTSPSDATAFDATTIT